VPQKRRSSSAWGEGTRVIALALATIMVTAAIPLPAWGQDKRAKARALVAEAKKLIEAGEYGDALDRIEKAYALVPSPKIQYNFGVAYNGLDRPADAVRAFQKFLAEAGDAPPANVAKARDYLATLNKKVGTLELEGDMAGAEVSVDGRSFGAATKVLVDPGPHQVTVEKTGRPPFFNRLTVAAGDRVRIAVRFPEPTPVIAAPPPPSRTLPPSLPPSTTAQGPSPIMAPPAMATPNPPPEEPKDNQPPAGTPWQYTAGWVSAGVAVVLLSGGLAGRLMANKKYADFNAYRDPPKVTACNKAISPDYGGSACRDLLSQGNTYSLLSWIGVIGGSAAAVAAVVFFVSAPSPSHTETAALTCAPSLGVVGASCRLTF
jgi:hypothetical protein